VDIVFLATLVPRIHRNNRFRLLESIPSCHWKTVNLFVEESCFTPLHRRVCLRLLVRLKMEPQIRENWSAMTKDIVYRGTTDVTIFLRTFEQYPSVFMKIYPQLSDIQSQILLEGGLGNATRPPQLGIDEKNYVYVNVWLNRRP
jgi:hypothetical protein